MKSSKAMDEWVATLNGWRKSPFEVGQEGLSMAENGLSPEERQAIMDDRDSIGRGGYPKGWGPVPSEPKATVKSAVKWGTHPNATVADVPAIAKHIRSWTDIANPGTVEIPAPLFFAIGTAIESMKTTEAVLVPIGSAPKAKAASHVRYEWKAIKKNYADDALRLNPLFESGWEFHDVEGPTYLLKRQVTQE